MNHRRGSGTRNLSKRRRVLVVDDNHDSAELLAMLLEREGHETRVAHDPREAIPLAREFAPNVAFLDIGLPGMSGFELLQVLRRSPEMVGCKFVAVTGYEELPESGASEVFDAHLVKPINLDAVVELVQTIGDPEPLLAPSVGLIR